MKTVIKDNSDITEYTDNPIVKELVDRELQDLERENFIVFPPTIKESKDLRGNNMIFSSHNRHIRTGNIVGKITKGNEEINIHSRFFDSKFNCEDYFIKYLIQKVLNLNVINATVNEDDNQNFYNLLVYLFPMYLNNAMNKGVYKEYVKKKFNDYNIKGKVNIAEHIKNNVPFNGKFSYETREFSYDNKLNQLIRYTIDKISMDFNLNYQLENSIKENVRLIMEVTPTYSKRDRLEILKDNISNPIRHGYFDDYSLLQQICIRILNEELAGYGNNTNEVQGFLIDVSWLWEEYLNSLIGNEFIHSQNRICEKGVSLFCDRNHTIYPDFYNNEKKVVLDAKYKMLDYSEKGLKREDIYQIISYLHVLKYENAGIIYPSKSKQEIIKVGELKGYGGYLFKLPLKIPQKNKNYESFLEEINENEKKFMYELVKQKNKQIL